MTDHKVTLAQKLFNNTINDNEIKDLEQKLKTDNHFEFNFMMNFLNPLFFNDYSNTLVSLSNINKRLPNFIPNYVKFCLRSNIDCFFSTDKEKNDFYRQLIELIRLLIEHNFINLDYIIIILNNVHLLDLKFAKQIIESFPHLKEISPTTIENFDKFNFLIQNSINDPTLCVDVAWPTVIIGDSSNPRISKFGGSQPLLPDEGYTLCSKCQAKCSMVCQIYVPTTPEWFQAHFPPEYRDSLIVVVYCNSCYLGIEAKFYTKEKLNAIVYADDVVYPGVVNYTFNEPRIVTGWTSGKMMPSMGNFILNNIASLHNFHFEELSDQFSRFNFAHGPKGDNLTYIGGWPEFVQDDCTPEDSFLVINLSESCSSTAMWGDAGTAQVWMENPINDFFGKLITHWACC